MEVFVTWNLGYHREKRLNHLDEVVLFLGDTMGRNVYVCLKAKNNVNKYSM